MIYAFWNNKGGTGKTSLAFQSICRYAEVHPGKKILVIDLCPQANLSELLLGGLEGDGNTHLNELYKINGRQSIGGYFQKRFPSPYQMPSNFDPNEFICSPRDYNSNIPSNIDLVPGDRIVELQTSGMHTLSNTTLPGINTWISIVSWLKDYIATTNGTYQTIFIDTNPSFSIYTQIALAAADRLIVPVMADDSSRRAVQNAFSLVYGIQLPSNVYDQYSYSTKMNAAGVKLPQVHLVVKNRITQYMGSASAYHSVLTSIDDDLDNVRKINPSIFTFPNVSTGVVEIRDFQTTGVVAFALGKPFSMLKATNYIIRSGDTQIKTEYLNNCRNAINALVARL
jgi:cellulose biosynthesis protein BcsQ